MGMVNSDEPVYFEGFDEVDEEVEIEEDVEVDEEEEEFEDE